MSMHGSQDSKRRTSRGISLSLDTLEGRRLMTAGVASELAQVHMVATHPVAETSTPANSPTGSHGIDTGRIVTNVLPPPYKGGGGSPPVNPTPTPTPTPTPPPGS